MNSNENENPITEINVTPLVDVSLVLVIIFMAVAPFTVQSGITASQAKEGASKGKQAAQENVQLYLEATGTLKLNGKPVAAEDLPAVLERAIAASKDRLVSLTADERVEVRRVVELLDLSKQKGAQKLVIMGQNPKEFTP